MTAQTPIKARKATRPRTLTLAEAKQAEEADLIRWSPEEVVKLKLLPYRSARTLREACYKRRVFHHNDGGRITFSPMSIRREHERTLVAPLAA
ncbi:hypothetical protein [Streptomyces showdoensis]|uniref:Uncharacterized protein n=1 Tax=Streptomyces showdoensis TaxID=68268 RepID=A0A2P2GTR3_STREW|nr:hypothetical protein [Streptomyces showdoensis]KKZ74890.1 hypothetical protein VO63_05440 [Streptomyces showdoensis]